MSRNRELMRVFKDVGLVEHHAVYLHWACTAPHNNKHEYGSQKYVGVGVRLFAIAADKSIEWGYLHQYQFFIDEEQAKKLLEVYHYEWNEA